MIIHSGRAALIRQKTAASPYASLGTLLYESAGGASLTIPFNSGIAQPVAGTILCRAMWTDVSDSTNGVAGSDGRSSASSQVGVVMMNLTNGAFRGRIVGLASGVATTVQGNTPSGSIVVGTWYSLLLSWDASNVIGRLDSSEHVTPHTLDADSWIANENIFIGNTAGSSTWNHLGSIRKAAIFGNSFDATARANAIAQLDTEGP